MMHGHLRRASLPAAKAAPAVVARLVLVLAVAAALASFVACTTTGPTNGAPRGPGFVELLARTTADAGIDDAASAASAMPATDASRASRP